MSADVDIIRKAPWPDDAGNDLFEGDTIEHPSGEKGVIEFREDRRRAADQWFVNYGDGIESRLCIQLGGRGQAVKSNKS